MKALLTAIVCTLLGPVALAQDDTPPAEDDTAAPTEDDTAAPSEDDTAAPSEDDTAAPSEDDTVAPDEVPPAYPRLPVLEEAPPAAYPPEALAAELEGTVLLEMLISSLGEVVSAKVVEPAGNGFDEAALSAVQNFVFSPALDEAGEPAEATIQYAYTFSLDFVPVVSVIGRVLQAGTRQPLNGARVTVFNAEGASLQTAADADGAFRFADLPDGAYAVAVSAPGFTEEATNVNVSVGNVAETTFYLRPDRQWEQVQANEEMIIVGDRVEPEVIERRLRADEIRAMPGTGGDIVRAVQSLPGVARSPFNAGQVVVRGTSPEDSAFYLGGLSIPIVFHFGGLSTVVNSDSLGEVAYMPGNYGVRYGRRLGGAIDLRTDKRLPDRSWGYVSVDLFQSALFLEQKLDDHWALTVSGRRSYIDTLLSPFIEQFTGDTGTIRLPRFSDAQLRLLRRADNGSTVDTMFLLSDDRFSFTETDFDADGGQIESEIFTRFRKLWFQWQQRYEKGWMTELTLIGGPDETRAAYRSEDSAFEQSVQYGARFELYRGVPEDGWAGWRMGVDVELRESEFEYALEDISSFVLFSGDESGIATAVYPGVYLEQTQREGRFEATPGIRMDAMLVDSGYQAISIDPRFSVKWETNPLTTLRASVGRYSQFPLLREILSTSNGNPLLAPEWSLQSSVGLQQELTPELRLEVTGYYMWLNDLIAGREDRFVFILGPPPTAPLDTGDYANDGTGINVGVESLIRYEDPRLMAWLGATVSRATRVKRPGLERSLFEYDQPLVLTAVGSYKLPRSYTIGLRGRFASGNPYTPVVNRIFSLEDHEYLPVYDTSNTARTPSFYTIDLRVDKMWTFRKWKLTGYLDLQNATNRRNVELIQWSYDWSEEIPVYGLPIIPAFGLRGEW